MSRSIAAKAEANARRIARLASTPGEKAAFAQHRRKLRNRKLELCSRIQQITFELRKLGGVYASTTLEYQKLFLEREQLQRELDNL